MFYFRKFQIFVLFLVMGAFIIILSSAAVESAPSANEQIRIYPATPSFSQPFFVTVSGQWANTCVPVFQRVEVEEYRVWLEAKTPGPLVSCTESSTDWGFSVLIPPQPPNFREAELSVVSGITGAELLTLRHEFDVKGGIQVLPGLPLAGESVSLRLADLSPDGCTPNDFSHEIITQTVSIEVQIPDVVCGQVPTPWEMDVPLGPLSAGQYQAEVFVIDHRFTPPRRTRLLDQFFTVAGQIFQTYLPLWGCFGPDVSPLACPITQTPDGRGVKP